MKRFYKDVSTALVEGSFAVLLDGKSIRTPGNQPLALPTKELAEAIAAEWHVQKKDILPASMPLMQLAATAIDHVPTQRDTLTQRLLAYIDTELLCLRENPANELRARQDADWQPALDWLKSVHGIELNVGEGLKAPGQSSEARRAFERQLAALDDWALTGLSEAGSVTGSLVLALALKEAALSPQKVFELAELESLYQTARWGLDDEAQKRHKAIQGELDSLAKWFDLIKR